MARMARRRRWRSSSSTNSRSRSAAAPASTRSHQHRRQQQQVLLPTTCCLAMAAMAAAALRRRRPRRMQEMQQQLPSRSRRRQASSSSDRSLAEEWCCCCVCGVSGGLSCAVPFMQGMCLCARTSLLVGFACGRDSRRTARGGWCRLVCVGWVRTWHRPGGGEVCFMLYVVVLLWFCVILCGRGSCAVRPRARAKLRETSAAAAVLKPPTRSRRLRCCGAHRVLLVRM